MTSTDRRSWFDKVIGACFCVLLAGAAVYIGVHLVLAVAVALLVIVGCCVGLAGAVAWYRNRRDRW